MSEETLPSWPKYASADGTAPYRTVEQYERARADAWEARLRQAKPALELAAMTIGCACACIRCKTASDRVHEALSLIGPLPPLGDM